MLWRFYEGIFIVGIMLTTYLPLDFYYDGASLYSFGKAAIATYALVAWYIVAVVFATVVLKTYIKPQRIYALLFWMSLWIICAVIQYLNPKLLVVSFGACIGALIMYFELENPQGALSRRTGHFSSAVIRDYFDYLYQRNKHFSVMMISFRTLSDANTENKLLRKSIEMLSDFLFSINTAKVFDTAEGYFLLVFDNTDFMESTKFKINTYFQSIEDSPDKENAITLMNPIYTIVPDCNIVNGSDELLMLLTTFVPTNHDNNIKNEVIVNEDAVFALHKRKQAEKMVIEAMNDDRVEVHYQPIYDIATGKFTSAEALVRIRLSDGTLIYPDEFIPIMEETGRIIPLSDTIYKKVLSFIKLYRVEILGIERIELNLSVKQGESPVFVSRFLEQLEKDNVSPSLINLEVTETSSLRSKEILLTNMKKLMDHGITFSLDDFGSGSSNLNYIIDMPVTIVKLDKHLTDEYLKNNKAQAIVKTVIDMAHSMDIRIIAEGIEAEPELEAMKSAGVDYIQGYYFSKPLPEHEYLKFIQNNNL
jgi:EAL domain-containing protein (putative c-di-GMP-specific phosphodiesterase class I)